MTGQHASDAPRRFHELDSIRGLAALMVVFSHFVLIWQIPWRDEPGFLSFLRYPFITGHEAVMLFFLLSGFVLSLPYLGGKRQPYLKFIARRVLRIYGPYLFALGLAVAGAAVFQPHPGVHGVWADQTWSKPVNGRLVLQHVLMIGNYEWAQYNTAFWSLIHEMRISLIFPLLYLVISPLRARYALGIAAAFTVLDQELLHFHLLREQTASTLGCVSIFILGILLAKHLKWIGVLYSRMPALSKALLAVGSFALYSGGHLLGASSHAGLWRLADLCTTTGAIGFIVLALHWSLARAFLLSPAPQFLGRISYSLYLVHATVLFAVVSALHGRIHLIPMFVLYLMVSLTAGWIFCLAVEEPFAGLSRQVGRRREVVLPAAQPSTSSSPQLSPEMDREGPSGPEKRSEERSRTGSGGA